MVMLSPSQSLVSTRMASKACEVLIETKICLSCLSRHEEGHTWTSNVQPNLGREN